MCVCMCVCVHRNVETHTAAEFTNCWHVQTAQRDKVQTHDAHFSTTTGFRKH